jgi:hypothetical protein
MYTLNDLKQSRWREEIDADYPCHIYVTRGRKLVAYVKRGSTTVQQFTKPLTAWNPSKRSFRDLTPTEIKEFV